MGAIKIDDIEDFYKKELNITMDKLNDPLFLKEDPKTAAQYCAAFRVLSEIFECCGVTGPSDFKLNVTFTKECCVNETISSQIGCADKSWDTIFDGVVSYFIVPNSVIVAFEFCLIVGVPIFIKTISKRKKRDDYIPTFTPTYYKNQ